MRRLITALMFLMIATGARCQKNCSVRTDLSRALCFGAVDLAFCHKIDSRWSIEGQTAVNTKRLSNGKDDETTQHWNALSGIADPDGKKTFRENLTELSFCVGFWPREVFRGPVFSIGGLIRDRTGPDIFCSFGYSLPIWKGLSTDIGFRICLLETKRTEKLQYNGIRIGLSYAF